MLVHGVQVHPVNRRPLHVDLFAVRMTEELTVEVPLIGTGTAPAVECGGTLIHPTSTVRVRALPGQPAASRCLRPVVARRLRRTITVADLAVPGGRDAPTEPTEVVARVLAPRVEGGRAGGGRRRGRGAEEGEAAAGGEAAEGGESARATPGVA